MVNASYLSLPPCKYAEFFFYYRQHLIVLEGWMGAVTDITIIIGRLQGDAIALDVLIAQNFSGSISFDLQVTVLSWFAG